MHRFIVRCQGCYFIDQKHTKMTSLYKCRAIQNGMQCLDTAINNLLGNHWFAAICAYIFMYLVCVRNNKSVWASRICCKPRTALNFEAENSIPERIGTGSEIISTTELDVWGFWHWDRYPNFIFTFSACFQFHMEKPSILHWTKNYVFTFFLLKKP